MKPRKRTRVERVNRECERRRRYWHNYVRRAVRGEIDLWTGRPLLPPKSLAEALSHGIAVITRTIGRDPLPPCPKCNGQLDEMRCPPGETVSWICTRCEIRPRYADTPA